MPRFDRSPPVSRRSALQAIAGGFGSVALAGLCQQAAAAYENPLAVRQPHLAPRAKRIIFLCMRGGPSQMETFDYKPKLNELNNQPSNNSKNKNAKYFGSQWKFNQYGESGLWISDLLPHTAKCVDDLCVIRSLQTGSTVHSQALDQLHTGSFQFVRPSFGSWVLYGLGTENQSLPGFITISPPSILGGAKYYASAFLPASYQGSPIGEMEKPIAKAKVGNIVNPRLNWASQRRQLDLLQSMNRDFQATHEHNTQLDGVIESFELAFRMQAEVPQVLDISNEAQATLDLYGIGSGKPTDDFGRQCLLGRRFAEAGVRFIELCHDNWDHHAFVSRLMPARCAQIDQPMAGLITDLKQRGLLDDTLVLWGGEFGRSPDAPTQDGRDHNIDGFTMWLAGGGVKGGLAYGQTDEFGFEAVENKMHIHDLHATILHLMGLDHERLTYRYAGRDFRLTDVHGRVVKDLFA